jgi:DNA-binding PadR family transcriptional regulator
MNVRTPAYLMLGMVRLGARSGYAIKKAADVSTHFFWPTSLAQVYPELARLERLGLITRRDDPRGARSRAAHEITAEGEAALADWLRSYAPEQTPVQFRDEGLLRLFFADALPIGDQRALVRLLRERARNAKRHMREQILPLAEAVEPAGPRYPAIVARLGADGYAHAERWLARLEEQLDAELSARS